MMFDRSMAARGAVGVILISAVVLWSIPSVHALSLGDAVRESLQNSPELREAVLDLDRAKLEEPGLLALTDPIFSASVSATDDRGPRASPAFQGAYSKSNDWEVAVSQDLLIGTESKMFLKSEDLQSPSAFRAIDPTVTTSFGLEIRQPLLRNFSGRPDKAKRRQARAGVMAAESALDRAREREAARSMIAFADAYTTQQNITIREAAVADAGKLLKTYQEKKRYGLVDASDLIQAEVSLRAQETELRLARSALKQAEETLRRALYRKDATPIGALQLPDPPSHAIPAPEEAWTRAAAHRGDFRSEMHLVERAENFELVEKLRTLPDLSLFGEYSWGGLSNRSGQSWREVRDADKPVYTTGIELEIPFFGKQETIRREEAALALKTARARRDQLEADLRQEVNEALESLRLAKDRVAAYQELVALEKRKLSAAQEDFQRGRVSTDLLIRFQSDIHRTEALLLQANADLFMQWARLSLATGTLLEDFAAHVKERSP